MTGLLATYDATTRWLSGKMPESLVLLFVRVVLGGIFWRAGETKVEPGSWFTLKDSTIELFRTEYSGVPLLPPEIAAVLANFAEHVLPALLLIGFCTRFASLGLLGMTMVIQLFVYPEAWWPEHSLWIGLALIMIARGPGLISLDHLLVRATRK